MLKINLKKEHLLLIAIFFVFIFLRIFSDSPYYPIIGGDGARYLTLADNFPYHTLFNNQYYVQHPPLYPYLVHFVSFLFEDYIAGMLISLISSAITFFIIYKLVRLVSNSYYISLGTLILLSLSQIYIGLSIGILKKEPFAIMLALAAIYYYIRFLKEGKTRNIIYSSIPALLLGITTDHAILLIPVLVVTYIFFRNKTKIYYASIPLIAVIFSYSLWLFTRLYTYATHEFYPAAVEGSIVKTSEWGLRQLLSPHFFKDAELIVSFGLNFHPLHYFYPIANMFSLIIAPWPNGLRFSNISMLFSMNNLLQIIIYITLAIAVIYGVYVIIKSFFKKGIKNNGMLFFLIIFMVFIVPLTQEFISYRYTANAIVFLFIIISYGFFEFAKKYGMTRTFKMGINLIILILILYLPFYYLNNPYFILSKEKIIEVPNTAKFINKLPKDGVMAQIGYPQEISYQTNKRTMALPINEDFFFLLDIYDINYLVYGEFYHSPFSEDSDVKVFNHESIRYIRAHPERFKLLEIIEETYPTTDIKDHIYIYEVISK